MDEPILIYYYLLRFIIEVTIQWGSCNLKKIDILEHSCAYLPPGTPAGHLSALLRNACGYLYMLGVKHLMGKPSPGRGCGSCWIIVQELKWIYLIVEHMMP